MLNKLGAIWISTSLLVIGFGQEQEIYPKKLTKEVEGLKKKLDMLVKADLKVLLPVLHDIVNFYLDSKNDIDLNLEYGMFLLNVIIKRLLEEKDARLPKSISFSLKHLLEKNNELITAFKSQVDHDKKPEDKVLKTVLTLYSNESVWMSQLKKFDIKHRNKLPLKIKKEHVSKYGNITYYERLFLNSTPTPSQADYCIKVISAIPISNIIENKCKIPNQCVKLLYRGSNFGYPLTHRLMMLQFAHFGRRCHLSSSVEKDRKLEYRLCRTALQEAEFISEHDYQHADIMMEQITFCALIGHFEFLKRSWLVQLVRLRTVDGCFTGQIHHEERKKTKDSMKSEIPWNLNKDVHATILSGLCEAEVTNGALTTIILAVKYLLEAFY